MNASSTTRSRLRWGAAAVASAIAGTYLLIGTEVVRVPGVAEVEPGPAVPLVIAGAAFAALAARLVWRPGRLTHTVGALLCLLTIAGYLLIAPDRDPSYEPWGLTIKALQLLLFGLLSYALLRPASSTNTPTDPDTGSSARPRTTRTREHSGRS